MGADRQPIRSFRDLIAWQLAYALGLDVIRSLGGFPAEERFGLALQLRKSSVSVASNIAEGFGRGSKADYIRFLYMARGSLYELNTQLSFATDLGYLGTKRAEAMHKQVDECERVLWGLIRALEANPK
ncbi:MAG: four helix bundle protein [Phycisphaeraceae bacterium]|nr:four helix bundle protein [Phycisphaeraceae bacterium]